VQLFVEIVKRDTERGAWTLVQAPRSVFRYSSYRA
jgi:hypothetical protein